jgi:hypothetical protein
MHRQNALDSLLLRGFKERSQGGQQSQFNVHETRLREEALEKAPAFLQTQLLRTALAEIACCNDYWRGQMRNRLSHGVGGAREVVESEFKEIWGLLHSGRDSQSITRSDDAHQEWCLLRFDRIALYHILGALKVGCPSASRFLF